MQRNLESYYGKNELAAYFELNQEIHRKIVAGAQNTTLSGVHGFLLARAERARYLALGSRTRWVESIKEHEEILSALEHRDAKTAGQRLKTHVKNTGRQLINGLLLRETGMREAAE